MIDASFQFDPNLHVAPTAPEDTQDVTASHGSSGFIDSLLGKKVPRDVSEECDPWEFSYSKW